MRLDRLLSNRGYCSRSEVKRFIRENRIRIDNEPAYSPSQAIHNESVFIDDEPIDPEIITIMLHKPIGFVCSHREQGRLIYELLPERWSNLKPQLSSVGRLDKESSGLLILTNDGQLNHQLTQPKKVGKVYAVKTRDPLSGNESSLFSSGTFTLPDEEQPLLPATFLEQSPHSGLLTIHEGKYHQIRRMFAAVGNEVIELHRTQIGDLPLLPEEPGAWCFLTDDQLKLALAPSFSQKHN
jgi:16S rRNA pseudouridine516 synthase